ncbi:MAG: class I tRNA ligase family protein, partial [Gallionellaceae bacterium]|nr:class I tRNA ligase family protein [Gallionellaceae bacterium]
RIRNTLRFLLANISDFDPQQNALQVSEWLEVDRYALALTQRLQNEISGAYEKYEFHVVVQKLQTFCSEDLGGFYLDILKDRLYTAGENSTARRSAQHALYHITHSLTRLMAPILSFTAEEVWQVLSGKHDQSVFQQAWHKLPVLLQADDLMTTWTTICAWRAKANKQIEEVRAAGHIGQALAAEADIYAAGNDFDLLTRLGDDLRFVLITSRATVHRAENETAQRIVVTPSTREKCERCWHYRADVGSDSAHPQICGRCVSNLFGSGEVRKYA